MLAVNARPPCNYAVHVFVFTMTTERPLRMGALRRRHANSYRCMRQPPSVFSVLPFPTTTVRPVDEAAAVDKTPAPLVDDCHAENTSLFVALAYTSRRLVDDDIRGGLLFVTNQDTTDGFDGSMLQHDVCFSQPRSHVETNGTTVGYTAGLPDVITVSFPYPLSSSGNRAGFLMVADLLDNRPGMSKSAERMRWVVLPDMHLDQQGHPSSSIAQFPVCHTNEKAAQDARRNLGRKIRA